jgi:DTW domain-containing protein
VCAALVELDTRTRILILQHPRESSVPIGTAKLAELAFRNAERHVGIDFSDTAGVCALLKDAARPAILLYPGEAARSLEREPPPGPVTLVVIDGTWWQSAKILKQNPALAELPRYALSPAAPSRYRIRREPAVHCVSTIEAIVLAVSLLEGPESRAGAALQPFELLVEQQLWFASERRARRHVSGKGVPRRPAVPALLRQRAGDLVVAYGEANAWPRGTPLGSRPEIVHWAAERPFTGERFEARIAPRRPLAPSFSHHTGLPEHLVTHGETWESFCGRWGAFTRPTDILCGWGYFASELLKTEGVPLPERLDIRHLAGCYLRHKPGDVEKCAALLGQSVDASTVPGRTGARLGGLKAVVRALVAASA